MSLHSEGLSQDGEGQQLWVTALKGDEKTNLEENDNDNTHPAKWCADAKIGSEPEGNVQEQDLESRTLKQVRDPKGPTKQERDHHELLHPPYRAWCKHCVRGRQK